MTTQGMALNQSEKTHKKELWYSGTDTLRIGDLVCYNRDYGTAADLEYGRAWQVEKPSATNLNHFAGVISRIPSGGGTGPGKVEIIEPIGGGLVEIYTDQTCVIEATRLTLVADQYEAGADWEGFPVATAMQTVNRGSDSGKVLARFNKPPNIWLVNQLIGGPKGLTQAIWADCAPFDNPYAGTAMFDDFSSFSSSATADEATWQATQQGAGTLALDSAIPGIALADSGSTTQHQGINVQRNSPGLVPIASTNTYFEARVKIVDAYNLVQVVVGLATKDTTAWPNGVISNITTIGALTVGTGNAGLLKFSHQRGGTGGSEVTLATFLEEDTYIKLGFKQTGVTSAAIYVDGAEVAITEVAADLPNALVFPTLVCQSDGTSADPIMHVDWIACGQTITS